MHLMFVGTILGFALFINVQVDAGTHDYAVLRKWKRFFNVISLWMVLNWIQVNTSSGVMII